MFLFVIWILTGDLPFLSDEWDMPNCNSNEFCWMCRCNRGDCSFTDFRMGAGWRRSLLDWDEGRSVAISTHPIWTLIGISRWNVPGDLMHTGCLGILLWLLGAVLYELIFHGSFSGTIDHRRQELWTRIQRNFSAMGVSIRIDDIDIVLSLLVCRML